MLKYLVMALSLLSAVAYADNDSNQVFDCQISNNQEITMTLEPGGLLTYHFQDAEHPERSVFYPDSNDNRLLSVYHAQTPLPMQQDIYRVSFHVPEQHATTTLSVTVDHAGQQASAGEVRTYVNNKLLTTWHCQHAPYNGYLLRNAFEHNDIARSYSVDTHDPF